MLFLQLIPRFPASNFSCQYILSDDSTPIVLCGKLWVAESVILQEHLLIVCELLKANLYEFQKFNRESGGEVYFTMPRLQVCGASGLLLKLETFLFLISI